MANETLDLIDFIKQPREAADFRPYAYYGREEDALKLYFKGDPDYARRINSRVTLYLSLDTDELVGIQVKNVRQVLEDIGYFDIAVNHGKVKVQMLFAAYHCDFTEDESLRSMFRETAKRLSDTELPDDLLQSTCDA